MNKIIIFPYTAGMDIPYSGVKLIPRLNDASLISEACHAVKENNRLDYIWLDIPSTNLSDIEFRPEWEGTPITIHAAGLGEIYKTIASMGVMSRLDLRIFLSSKNADYVASLKILSSLGINCGVLFDGEKLDDDEFMDLASYAFLSPVMHAGIEPFDFIKRNVNSSTNPDFSSIYFDDPQKYLIAQNDLSVHEPGEEEEFQSRYDRYYSHFQNLDECSKCPSFKICNRRMKQYFSDCKEVFATIYEYVELKSGRNMNQQNNQ